MGRKDPRVDPVSEPPNAEPAVESEMVSGTKTKSVAPKPAPAEPTPAEPTPDTAKSRVVTSTDPRLEIVQPLLARSDWAGIIAALGPPDNAGELPPHMGLLLALAMNETQTAESVGDPAALAIRCAAGLFGVPAESTIAVVIAKRLLRKNPLSFGKRPAPPARVSFLIVAITLVVGAGVGWILTGGGSLRSLFG